MFRTATFFHEDKKPRLKRVEWKRLPDYLFKWSVRLRGWREESPTLKGGFDYKTQISKDTYKYFLGADLMERVEGREIRTRNQVDAVDVHLNHLTLESWTIGT